MGALLQDGPPPSRRGPSPPSRDRWAQGSERNQSSRAYTTRARPVGTPLAVETPGRLYPVLRAGYSIGGKTGTPSISPPVQGAGLYEGLPIAREEVRCTGAGSCEPYGPVLSDNHRAEKSGRYVGGGGNDLNGGG